MRVTLEGTGENQSDNHKTLEKEIVLQAQSDDIYVSIMLGDRIIEISIQQLIAVLNTINS